jgi:4-amino-4-deoxy-L-arabinose transferase-like glycosyltransferase
LSQTGQTKPRRAPVVHAATLAALLAVGLFMRAAILWVAPPIDQDQALHCTVASHVRDGRWAYRNSNGFNFYSLQESGLSPYNHPLYHLVTGMVARVLGNVEHAARTVSFAAGLGAMIVLFLVARLLLPPLWALVVLAVVALHPGLAYLSATAYTESLYLFMLSVALWCVAALWQGGRVWPLVAGTGVAVGLAALTKPEANLLAPVYAVFAAAGVMRAAAARPPPAVAAWGARFGDRARSCAGRHVPVSALLPP